MTRIPKDDVYGILEVWCVNDKQTGVDRLLEALRREHGEPRYDLAFELVKRRTWE